MTEKDDLAARLEVLETRIAYQDEIIEDLNKTLTAQWTQLDRMARELALLAERVQQAEQSVGSDPEDEPPPPHY